jgi:hypothetical protein
MFLNTLIKGKSTKYMKIQQYWFDKW